MQTEREKQTATWRMLLAFALAVFGGAAVGLCSAYFAAGTYGFSMVRLYASNPYILWLNMAPPILLSALFYLLFNRAMWSFLATNFVVMVPTIIHYYKVAFRSDVLIAEDAALVGEAANMLETYELFIDDRMIAYFAVLILGTALYGLSVRGRFRRAWPRLVAAVALCLASCSLVPLYTSNVIYEEKTHNPSLINQWSDTQVYISKGFVYPFLHSVKSAFHPAPEGYSAEEAEAILAKYPAEDIPEEKKVNIVCIMLEAYNDFSRFEELTFVQDVYGKYQELEAMGYSGTLITDIFAGDTRVSEREFLTGMPYSRLDSFVANSNSHVWYLRENGYTVEGAHPCYAWFYNRQNINEKLGFENYYFSENYFQPLTGGNITYDARFFPLLAEIYEMRDKEKPYFSYNISYQGHGPYEAENAYFTEPYIENPGVSRTDETILNNYLNSQKETTEMLYNYVQTMLATEDPLVLVLFGDHKPWMGNGGSVYAAYGINMDVSTEEGFKNYYGTRYLILANDAAKQVTGNDFLGEGETISVSFLMNKVFELCGYKGSSYMQFVSEFMQENPVLHRTDLLEEEDKKTFDRVSYYYRKNFLYDE